MFDSDDENEKTELMGSSSLSEQPTRIREKNISKDDKYFIGLLYFALAIEALWSRH